MGRGGGIGQGGGIALAALAAFLPTFPLRAEITGAGFDAPTTRYDHAILGDAIEWGALVLDLADGRHLRITLPESRVFEDLAPRLVDLDRDGAPEVIVVETDLARGARLSIYGERGLITASPFIGRAHRWLAPAGAADLDGDGFMEVAWVDRPHLAKILKIARFRDGRLEPVAEVQGFSNHRIGDDFITGGVRDCGSGAEIAIPDADWQRIMAVRLEGGEVIARVLGAYSPDAISQVLACGR